MNGYHELALNQRLLRAARHSAAVTLFDPTCAIQAAPRLGATLRVSSISDAAFRLREAQ